MKLTLGKKIGCGFGIALALMVVSTLLAYIKVTDVNSLQARIKDVRAPTSVTAEHLSGEMYQSTNKTREYILISENPALVERAKKDWETAWQNINTDVQKLEELSAHWTSAANKERLTKAKEILPRLKAEQEHSFKLADSKAGDSVKVAGLYVSEKVTPVNAEAKAEVADLSKSQEELMAQDGQALTSASQSTIYTLVGSTLAAIVIGSFVAIFLSRKITSATSQVLNRAEMIAEGDLTGKEIVVESQDEMGDLAKAINKMQESLRTTITSVADNAQRVASASEEISASATEQASGADTQKMQTEQVATAMQEMSSTVLEVSENSNKAAEAARKAAETARHGGKIVDDTLVKMRGIAQSVGETAKKVQELGKSSDQIGEIIGVIDDIADQTNLLALNAAIEAARAGEQGRGFAVVADEVRKLAERTSKATKEIADMIKNIQVETKSAVAAMQDGTKQVEMGVESTTMAGSSLSEIIQMADRVGEMVTHIATAATEQSSATEEVNNNIEQISKITSETAAGAQQSAKAVHELSNLALDLQNLVSQFKLSHNGSKQKSHGRPSGRTGNALALREREPEYEEVGVN